MPRPLIYSNGSFFVGVDDHARIRDLFFPHVGLFNHLSGHTIRVGLWIDGAFSWLDEPGWNRSLEYEPGALIGRIRLDHPAMGVQVQIVDAMDPELHAFSRVVHLQSTHGLERHVRLFFTHDLRISETDIGDTAFYNPFLKGIVHYKGPHWFYFGAPAIDTLRTEYATGIKGFAQLEGTWRDAEDGRLGMNPIAQGSVDSTLGLQLELDAQGAAHVEYWILASESLDGIEELLQRVDHSATMSDCRAAAAKSVESLSGILNNLPEDLHEFCLKSLLLVEAHCDRHGAILAATDSDIMTTNRANYGYCWPRDGAHASLVLDRLGVHEPTRRFFRFCAQVLSTDHPILLQKYRPDGTLGATWHPWIVDGKATVPFQEDESASVLHALGEHFKITKDASLLDQLYPSLVIPMADFIAGYRDVKTGLPLASYDLWEERRGVHLYTAAAVFAGLRSAAELANRMEDPRAFDYREASTEIRRAVLDQFSTVPEGTFCRSLDGKGGHDPTADASTLFLGLFEVVDPSDPLFARQMEHVRAKLWTHSGVGGLARYEGDYYFRQSDDFPGNPWVICTLWLAQCQIARAQRKDDLEEPLELLRWALRHAASTHVLPEQLHPEDGTPLSVSPLAWSHAEVLKTSLDWVEKARTL